MLGGALDEATKKITTLQQAEKALSDMTYKLMFAGAAFFAFGSLLANGLKGFLDYTSKGTMMMESLGLAWDRFASRFGAALADNLEDDIKWIVDVMDMIGEDKGLLNATAWWAVELTKIGVIGGGLVFIFSWIAKLVTSIGGFIGKIVWGAMGFFPGTRAAVHFAATQLMESIVSAFTGIGATVTGIGAGGVLGIAFAVGLTFVLGKTLWDWYSTDNAGRVKMGIDAGIEAEKWKPKGYIDNIQSAEGLAAGMLPQDITINIYGNFNGTPSENGNAIADEIGNAFK